MMIEKTFELGANFVQVFLWLWFITKFFGFKNKSPLLEKLGFTIAWILVFLEISFINKIFVYDGFVSIVIFLTFIIYGCMCLDGKAEAITFINLFVAAIIYTLGSLAIFITSYLSGMYAENMISDFTLWRVAGVLFCRIFEYLVFSLILKVNGRYALSKLEWLLFIALPLLTWVVVTLVTSAAIAANIVSKNMFYVTLIMVFMNIIIFFFMIKMKKDSNTKLEYELLKMQYDGVKAAEKNMSALYENVYSVKHDLQKHFLAIKTMAESEKNLDIKEYAEKIIEDKLNSTRRHIFTDNAIFDAVINSRIEICNYKNIHFICCICKTAFEFIPDEDIAVLFGNIIDNAIEAAEHSEEKIINLNVALLEDYVSIVLENTFNKNVSDISLQTSKDNKAEHGFGIKNVKKIVKERDGMIDFYVEKNGIFTCDIFLKKQQKVTNSTKIIPNSTK